MVVPDSVGEQDICFNSSIPLDFSPFQKPFGIFEIYQLLQLLLLYLILVFVKSYMICENSGFDFCENMWWEGLEIKQELIFQWQ